MESRKDWAESEIDKKKQHQSWGYNDSVGLRGPTPHFVTQTVQYLLVCCADYCVCHRMLLLELGVLLAQTVVTVRSWMESRFCNVICLMVRLLVLSILGLSKPVKVHNLLVVEQGCLHIHVQSRRVGEHLTHSEKTVYSQAVKQGIKHALLHWLVLVGTLSFRLIM